MKRLVTVSLAASALAAAAWGGAAWSAGAFQGFQDPAPRLAAQKKALEALAFLDGEWRGPAWSLLPDGSKHEVTQTERVGPMLGGSVRVIEGRGYEKDGTVGFNAFAIVSWDIEAKALRMRSYAQGRSGDYPVTVRPDGFSWEIPAGPATIRYTATIEGDSWHEVGHYVVTGQEPRQILDMTLTRIGDSEWPAAGAVGAK